MENLNSNRTHIIKRGSGWAVKKEGATRATKIYDTKEKAIANATRQAKSGNEIIIHTENGFIQEWRSKK